MSSRHATFLRYYAMPFSYKIIYAIISYVLLDNPFFNDKNLEMSSKLFKFANDNLLLTIGG